jgi:type II secretion system protein C
MNKLQDYYYKSNFRTLIQGRKGQFFGFNSTITITIFLLSIIILQLLNFGSKLLLDENFVSESTIRSKSQELIMVSSNIKTDPFEPNRLIINKTSLDEDVPPTSLPLRLYGIRYSDRGVADAAILGFDQNNQTIYSVNDVIEDDTILESILVDKVVISRSGIRESVSFNDTPLISGLSPYTSETTKVTQAKPVNISAQDIISFEPYFSNGTIKGYKVFAGQDKEAFNDSGLQSGDLLLAVNGISVNDPIIDVEMSNFSNQIDLDVLRGEISLSLTVELN